MKTKGFAMSIPLMVGGSSLVGLQFALLPLGAGVGLIALAVVALLSSKGN